MDEITMPHDVTDMASVIRHQKFLREQLASQRVANEAKEKAAREAERERQKAASAAATKVDNSKRGVQVIQQPDHAAINARSVVEIGSCTLSLDDDGRFGVAGRTRCKVVDAEGRVYRSSDMALYVILRAALEALTEEGADDAAE